MKGQDIIFAFCLSILLWLLIIMPMLYVLGRLGEPQTLWMLRLVGLAP